MPNTTGGKGYKRGKHTKDEKMIEWDPSTGQMLGRVVVVLGSRRFKVYCNDNQARTCRLAGSMTKSDWVTKGSLVLLSTRSLSTSTSDVSEKNLGDILHVFGTEDYRELKGMPGVNPAIFTPVETKELNEIIELVNKNMLNVEEDDLFLDEGEEEEEEPENETPAERAVRLAEKEAKRQAARLAALVVHEVGEDVINGETGAERNARLEQKDKETMSEHLQSLKLREIERKGRRKEKEVSFDEL
jgi:initiation factor 1A